MMRRPAVAKCAAAILRLNHRRGYGASQFGVRYARNLAELYAYLKGWTAKFKGPTLCRAKDGPPRAAHCAARRTFHVALW
jgi:hypothetical protein